MHRSWLKAEGFSDVVFDGRPVVGIANSWSELTNCNAHLRQVADAVKRGVKPTTMRFRNLMAMDVEECIRPLPARPRRAAVGLRRTGIPPSTITTSLGMVAADPPRLRTYV